MLGNLTKEEIRKLAREDKKSLLASKSAEIKYTDSLAHAVARPTTTSVVKEASSKADEPVTLSVKEDTLDVTIVCNTAWFVDSQMDVLTDSCYSKSVAEKGVNIPHIADHKQSSTSHVGDVTKVYTKKLPLADLGYEKEGSTTALVMESTVRKNYNEDVYKFYANGKINQHSIGLRYLDIQLAINSKHEEDKEEFAVWEEGYEHIINKEAVDEKGYFWLVKEINIIENSCVLFGANSLTPTLEVKSELGEETGLVQKSTASSNNLPTTKGTTMTPLEEALAKNLELTSEVAELKAQVTAASVVAVAEEKARSLGILKAATTLGIDQEVAIKRIASKSSVEDATEIFTAIAEATQKSNPVDTTGAETTTLNPTVVSKGTLSFSEQLDASLKEAPAEQLFKEVG